MANQRKNRVSDELPTDGETQETPPPAGGTSEEATPRDGQAVSLVPMQRSEPMHPGGPTRADVHSDEVANWRAAGWREAEA